MEIILHIGTDKTGSTAVQRSLSKNRNWFLSRSIYIPKSGFSSDAGHATILKTLDANDLKALSTELEKAKAQGYRVALISWEGMSFFSSPQIRRLANALPSFPIRVLIYLREQAEIIQSGHLQWIKMSKDALGIATIAQPCTSRKKIAAFLFKRDSRRNYYHMLRQWERCIPDAKFTARVFSKSTLYSGEVVADLLHLLQLSIEEGFEVATENQNPSIDVELALFIEMWRQSKKSAQEVDELVYLAQLQLDQNANSTKCFLDEASVQSIRKYFKRSNQKLAKRYMDSEQYPFSDLASCWRKDDWEEVQARAVNLLQKVSQRTYISSGAAIHGVVDFIAGWHKPEHWGMWSLGKTSVARFCIPQEHLNDEVDAIRLVINGRYCGNNNTTSIVVNSVNFGQQDLSNYRADLVVPLTALLTNGIIEVVFSHQHPISPFELNGTHDNRALAFAMTTFGYVLIKPSGLV